jgi:multiple sugar transport system substrate-binding protein
MKRIMCLVLVVVLICGIMACNKSGKTTATAGDKKIELVWWTTTDGPAERYQPACQELVRQYNETNKMNTHLTVEFIGDNVYEIMLTAISAGSAPDAAVSWGPHPMLFGLAGEGLPLNSIMDAWKAEANPILNDVDQVMWDFNTAPDGTVYGLPFRYDPRLMTYRKDMFEKAGVTQMPKTWDEFLEVLRKLKKTFPDKIPFLVGGAQYMALHAVIGFGAHNDVGFFDKDMNPAMTSKEWIEMLEFFGTMRAEGLISEGSAGYLWDDVEKMYAAGEGAIAYLGLPSFLNGTEFESVSGIMPPIQGRSGTKQQTYAWVNGAFAFKQTDHPEETKDWLKWWSENNILMWTEQSVGSLPMRKSYQQHPVLQENRFMKEAITILSSYDCQTNTYPVPYMYVEFAQIEGEGIPGDPLREVMGGATNYAAIARKYQDTLMASIK